MQIVSFRLASYETPLWPIANHAAGRYNRAGTGPTQYLSLHPLTPWAELLRQEDRRTRERALLMRNRLWAVKLEVDDVALDLDFDSAHSFGLAPDDLVSDDPSACQAFAEGQRDADDGVRMFTAPSAALPGTTNLVILDAKVVIGFEMEPLGPEDLPTAVAAEDGRCPDGLWEIVHYRGAETPHPAYDAWRQDEDFNFEEPLVIRS